MTPSNVLHYDDAVPNDMDQQQTNTHEDDVDGKPKPNIPTFTETHVSDYSSCSDSEKELADAAYMRFKPEISQKRIARPSPLKPVYSKFLNSNSSLIPLGQMMPTSPLHSMVSKNGNRVLTPTNRCWRSIGQTFQNKRRRGR